MKLLESNSRQVQYARAFDRIASVYGKLWLGVFLVLAINIAAAMAIRFWPAAASAAGIEVSQTKTAAPEAKVAPDTSAEAETQDPDSGLKTLPALTMEIEEKLTPPATPVTPTTQTEPATEQPVDEAKTQTITLSDALVPASGNLQTQIDIAETDAGEELPPADTAVQDAATAIESNTVERPQDTTAEKSEAETKIVEADFAVLFIEILNVALPLLRVVGLICALLMAGVITLALHLTLLGRLGGADRLTAALVWSMVLVCIVVPWSSAFTGFPLPAATMLPAELIAATSTVMSTDCDWSTIMLYWARVAGYPALGLVICMAVELQWLLSRRPMNDSLPQTDRDEEEQVKKAT